MRGAKLLKLLVSPVGSFFLSLFGPAYFGFKHDLPYWVVGGWAFACSILFMWDSRASLRYAANLANRDTPVAWWFNIFSTFMIFLSVVSGYEIAHFAVYFLVFWLSK